MKKILEMLFGAAVGLVVMLLTIHLATWLAQFIP